ncbi:MAG TPA: hypothetical protein VFS47_02795 [Steroidobacteraceae bacterium]|nr:hypothetical protein [Steroidobacteraceae bacterium]
MKKIFGLVAIGLLASGCATVNPMAFDKSAKTIDTRSKSVILMTVDISRSDDSRYVPEPFAVKLEEPNAHEKSQRQNFKLNQKVDTIQEAGHHVYLVRMAVKPGNYKLTTVSGLARAFPFNGFFDVPVLADLHVQPNTITYIGRVSASLRHREEGEFRAGPLLPLVDQAATSMSTSTWDVVIKDNAENDLAQFRRRYPVLLSSTIEQKPLPPFDKNAAQKWWDGNASSKDSKTAAAGK